MPDRFQSRNGYEALGKVTPDIIHAVQHDTEHNPDSVAGAFADLTKLNVNVAQAVLCDAREAGEAHLDPEVAALRSAMLVVRLLAQQDKVTQLSTMFLQQPAQEERIEDNPAA